MTGYELSRKFWDFSFSNPDKVKPYHSAIFFFAIEHCNRLGWKSKFGFPTSMVMEATGIKSYSAYKRYLDNLVDWGFFTMIESSKNQYSSNIIALALKVKAHTKALDKALIKHNTKQVQSIDSIIKQLTKEQLTIKQLTNIKKIVLEYEKNEIVFPFESEKFKNSWDIWKRYKIIEHKFTYKIEDGILLIPLINKNHKPPKYYAKASIKDKDKLLIFSYSAHHNYGNVYAISNEKILMHVLVIGKKAPPGHDIDHCDIDGLNNTRENLNIISKYSNAQNKNKKDNCSSKFIGVDLSKGKWRGKIRINGVPMSLGIYKNEEDAAKAYDIHAINCHGIKCKTNNII